MLLRLALNSLATRWLTIAPTILATALSVALFVGVEKIRIGAEDSFRSTVSGVDLIVGARSGSVQLLLYSVFRIGNATNNITWESYQDIASHKAVEWAVPLSLGDSHRGFRVLGTSAEYFDLFRYRDDRPLAFAEGRRFDDLFDVVIGADVAAELGYKLGDSLIVAHGIASFVDHADKPFKLVGVLEKTGTPVDRTLHVSLEAIEAIHVDWQSGAQIPGQEVSAEEVRTMTLEPKAITAALVKMKSRLAAFRFQRAVNTYPEEPLLAILPGVALAELWALISVAETALAGVSAMVVATALLGLAAMIFASLNERRREMAILRSVGARPRVVLALLMSEAAVIALAGAALGLTILYLGLGLLQPYLDREYGLFLPITWLTPTEMAMIAGVVVAALLVSILPAWRAYRLSLADGMSVNI